MLKHSKILLLLCTLICSESFAQESTIILGKNSITINEEFTIAITFPKNKKKEFHSYPYSVFPQIEDMIKRQTEYIQDPVTKDYKIIQHYVPRKPGNFILEPFTLFINGMPLRNKGLKIKVSGESSKTKEPLKSENEGLDFKSSKESIYLKVFVNKTSVYLNEGISISVALLYPASYNSQDFTFIDLKEQILAITKKIKPSNCWIEEKDFAERNKIDSLVIDNKKYSRWNIYEGVFFPLDTNNVLIPALDFRVIKYQTALNVATTSIIRKANEETLKTSPLKIKVKSLPPHPFIDEVSSGTFQMEDKISSYELKTGKSFSYSFTIIGEGNISTIPNPKIKETEYFEIYSPQIVQFDIKNRNYSAKARSFNYYILPKEPGSFKLGDFIYWIYFDPIKNNYDTLSSNIKIKINGESQKNSYISSSDLGSFYNSINNKDNHLKDLKKDEFIKVLANFIILFMLVTTAILILKK